MLHGCTGLRTGTGAIQGKLRFWAGASPRTRLRDAPGGQLHPRGIDEVCTGRHMLSPVRDRADDARGALRYLQGRRRHAGRPDRRSSAGPTARRPTLSVVFDEGRIAADFRAAVAFYPNCTRKYPRGPVFQPLRAALHPDRRARRLDAGRAMHGDRRAIARGRGAHHDQGLSGRPPQLRRAGHARAVPARGEEPQRLDGDCGATVGTDPAARADCDRGGDRVPRRPGSARRR